jgi:outer membrane immunogenic protein
MKKLLLGGVALFTLALVGSAVAADMPIKAPPAPTNTWSGFYLGVDIGGVHGFGSADSFTQTGQAINPALLGCAGGCFDPVVFHENQWGVIAGAYGGYNWQFDPSFVLGVEADFSKASLSNGPSQLYLTFGGLPVPPCDPTTPGTCHGLLMGQNLSWVASARARLGYTIGSMMAYVTGGGAIASEEFSGVVAAAGFKTFSIATSANYVSPGWVAGGGLEFMATANWLLRLEYLHYALNSGRTVTVACTLCGPGAFSGNGNFAWTNATLDVIRAGLSYKIGP